MGSCYRSAQFCSAELNDNHLLENAAATLGATGCLASLCANSLLGYGYHLVLILHHISYRQFLNGVDVMLHVVEVYIAVRCNREANFTEFHSVPRGFLSYENSSLVIFSKHLAMYKRLSADLT